MEIEQLKKMKAQMALRGNWKEVKRINKLIKFCKRKKVTLSESNQTAEVSDDCVEMAKERKNVPNQFP